MPVNSPMVLWIGLAALVMGSVLSTLHHALRDVGRSSLEALAEARGGKRRLTAVRAILERHDAHVASLSLPRVVMNLAVMLCAVAWVWHLGGKPAPGWADLGIGLLIASALVWAFGAVIPTAVAEHAAESAVLAGAPMIRLCHVLFRPLSFFARGVDEVVRRLAGAERDPVELREAEVLSVVEEGERLGQFDEDERQMIEAVLEFRSTSAASIMTPRIEIEAMELTDNLGEVTRISRQTSHSRIPVYEGDLDHIVGIFYVKDLLRWLADMPGKPMGKPFTLRSILRPAIFVPETKTIRLLLEEMLAKRVHVVMVADEYGGTSGLVTMEDIVEEIFGDIQDEYESPESADAVIRVDLAGGVAEVDGREAVVDVNDELEPLGVQLPESDDYDTVGGYVITTLGRIPSAGETLQEGRLRVTVVEAEPTRVTRVRLEVQAEALAAQNDEGE